MGALREAVVEEVATGAGVSYLPLHERMVDALRERDDEPTPFGFDFALAYLAAAEHHLLGREWDEVARGNGLRLPADHVHLSDRGGAIVADPVDGWPSTPDSGRWVRSPTRAHAGARGSGTGDQEMAPTVSSTFA